MRTVLIQPTWTPHSLARLVSAVDLFSDHGHELEVVTVADRQHDYQWGTWSPAWADAALFPSRDYWELPYRELRASLNDALDASGAEVVVLPGWGFRESIISLGWALRSRVSTVLVSDSQRIDARSPFSRDWLKRPLVRSFNSAFVGGAPHIRYVEELGIDRSRCFVGCDVVDNDFFSRPSDGKGGDTLLSCVRLLPRKNLAAVLDALRATEGWRWLIAGDGPEREPLANHIEAAGLSGRVELLGHVPYEDLPALYARVDVYLQPSLSEPWGLAVNEAMAAGLPVIVSDRCGCREDLVTAENGIVFDPTGRRGIEDALAAMWQNRGHWAAMGDASRRVIAGWGLDLYATNLLASSRAADEEDATGGAVTRSGLARVL